jgi:hypothetical protein
MGESLLRLKGIGVENDKKMPKSCRPSHIVTTKGRQTRTVQHAGEGLNTTYRP